MSYIYGQRKANRGLSKTGIIDSMLKESDFQAGADEVMAEVLRQVPELLDGQDPKEVRKNLRGLFFSRRAVLAKKAVADKIKQEAEGLV